MDKEPFFLLFEIWVSVINFPIASYYYFYSFRSDFTGPLVYVMDMVDKIIFKVCPFVAGGIFVGSVYWTAVTYGAVTVMQVCTNISRAVSEISFF